MVDMEPAALIQLDLSAHPGSKGSAPLGVQAAGVELQNDHSILAESADEQRNALIMPADDAAIRASQG